MSAQAPATERGNLGLAVGSACFAAGYLATFFVSTALPTPLLWYLPLERRFAFAVRPMGLAADFYGRVLLSLAVGGLAAFIGHLLFRRATGARLERALRVLSVWTFALLVFTAAMYIYLLAGRTALPVPLPSGYVPR